MTNEDRAGRFWDISPKCGWVGWLIPKQGPNPSKPTQITPKIALFDPNFPFRFLKSHKNPGVGRWVNRFGIIDNDDIKWRCKSTSVWSSSRSFDLLTIGQMEQKITK